MRRMRIGYLRLGSYQEAIRAKCVFGTDRAKSCCSGSKGMRVSTVQRSNFQAQADPKFSMMLVDTVVALAVHPFKRMIATGGLERDKSIILWCDEEE